MEVCGIYGIQNRHTRQWYVGQSVDCDFRRRIHWSRLRHNRIGENQHLQRSFNKYGEEWFDFFMLEECSKDRLDSAEQYWVSEKNSNIPAFGFNMSIGGEGNYGHKHSKETIEKCRLSKLGLKRTPEHCKAISEGKKVMHRTAYNKGIPRTQELKDKLSKIAKEQYSNGRVNHNKGKKWSPETCMRISDAKKSQHLVGWNKGLPRTEWIKEDPTAFIAKLEAGRRKSREAKTLGGQSNG